MTPHDFTDILQEVQERPVYHTLQFGVVARRSAPPDYSPNCTQRAKLYSHLLDFGAKHVDVSFNNITLFVNPSVKVSKEKNLKGLSFLVGFGDYTGGELNHPDLSGYSSLNMKSQKVSLMKEYSFTPSQGVFYLLRFSYFENSRSVPLPSPSVRKEKEEYVFYRGEQKMTRPKKQKKRNAYSVVIQRGEFKVDFL